jgi:hypothetical protein
VSDEQWQQIVKQFLKLPEDCRAPAATEPALTAFEAEFGSIPAVYRRFLAELGGGAIGSEWVDGIDDLPASHRKFRAESAAPRGWTMKNVFIIGWDGAGNPMGIEHATGRVLVEDHNFGGIHEVSESFEQFLIRGLPQTSGED